MKVNENLMLEEKYRQKAAFALYNGKHLKYKWYSFLEEYYAHKFEEEFLDKPTSFFVRIKNVLCGR